MKTILIVDDESAARYGLRRALEAKYRVAEADSAEAAREALTREQPDLVLLDVVLPGQSGIEFLRWMREQGSDVPVLMVSALDTAKTAVEALQLGAADYLVKGFELEELRQRVANLLKLASLEKENDALRRRLTSEGQFVAVNCAALPETLIESELFGYERGAFTGAAQQKKGKFELASGGTLFLDEIGDMNPVTQAKVLRALENRTIERLAGSQPISVDVRVISATHRNLPAEIRVGKFREDLFYRLRVVTIELPPLRAHKQDIPVLAESFLQMHAARLGRAARLTREAVAAIERYDWPGNVRELKNALERSLVLCRGEHIGVADLPEEVARGEALVQKHSGEGRDNGLGEKDFREAKRKFEVAYLTKQLADHRWNVSRTAATIGLHRQSLQEKLRELGIRRPGREPSEDEEKD